MTNTEYKNKDLLRFLTCGSVDDGKSTLIGNLLYNSKRICKDQVEILKKDTQKHGTTEEDVDYALLMDGLASEREQGITIDVAYRYFETPSRKFIVADCPGHEQYTRNMVTGASTADMAVILIDARKGVLTQSKRHAFLVSLLQIPHVLVAVNKMDLVDYSEEIYNEIIEDFQLFCEKLDLKNISFIPVSALKGDNVITNENSNTPWYHGVSFLEYLENLYVKADRNLIDFRFPVQNVIRPNLNFRGFAGRIDSGTIAPGEEIVALPSGMTANVESIVTYDGKLDEAAAGESIVLTLDKEIDISRGDMIVRKNNLPSKADELDCMICWMSEAPMTMTENRFILKHTTRNVNAFIEKINYSVDVNSLHRQDTQKLELNDIARIQIKTARPLFYDPYQENRLTGSFILIDPITNNTVAAGMIRGETRKLQDVLPKTATGIKSKNIVWEEFNISDEMREVKNGHKGAVLWFTGLSGSGKSTIAKALSLKLFEMGCQVMVLDGDNVRHGLCSDLGFSAEDRSENIRRVGETAKLFKQNTNITLCSFISPYKKDRDTVRDIIQDGRFFEIFVKCDIDECKRRDPKGLYRKALAGEIKNFTGIDAPYEAPENPEIIVETDSKDILTIVEQIISVLKNNNIIAK
jgi:bifunctional enzyme CysN/CysC